MAWTEQIGTQSWRVRYRTSDGHTVSISGFATQRAADNYAADIESDQRATPGSTRPAAGPRSLNGSLPGSPRSISTHARSTTTAVSCAATSCSAGPPPRSTPSPHSA
jgi:hypothetical protein